MISSTLSRDFFLKRILVHTTLLPFHYLEALPRFEDVGLHFALLRFTFQVRICTPEGIPDKSNVIPFRASPVDHIYQGVSLM